ncbi:hypothetical protein B7Z17_04170 [Candidatus Saccharibacteria bacterium 32-49-10]|nr:MAG: hypothetical protein B7Z17_04170 [Candidatus Saccharibacteria bacterium 32-49-10]
MASVHVAISTVADGSMYSPQHPDGAAEIAARETWFAKQNLALPDATRVAITYDVDNFCEYRIVGEHDKADGMRGEASARADALITATPGHILFLPVADCVATTLFDAERGVLMLSHLGRHSLEQHGGIRSVEFLVKQYDVNPAKLQVWLSPAPGKQVYPIHKLNGQGMKEAVYEQLLAAGVLRDNINDEAVDTAVDDRYFSYSEYLKGNKPEGRFAMLAVMQ